MRGEGDKKTEASKLYRYKKCPACEAKIHIDGRFCLKCGADYWYKCFLREWEDIIYHSYNQENALYSMPMNYVEKCMKCRNVSERGIVCEKKYCFATSRGKCENCRTFDSLIFDCCQEVQAKEGVPNSNDVKKLSEYYMDIVRGKRITTPKTVKQEYEDEIPF